MTVSSEVLRMVTTSLRHVPPGILMHPPDNCIPPPNVEVAVVDFTSRVLTESPPDAVEVPVPVRFKIPDPKMFPVTEKSSPGEDVPTPSRPVFLSM
mgnify:CR=1 FL=1